jgi:hypothetical protein
MYVYQEIQEHNKPGLQRTVFSALLYAALRNRGKLSFVPAQSSLLFQIQNTMQSGIDMWYGYVIHLIPSKIHIWAVWSHVIYSFFNYF